MVMVFAPFPKLQVEVWLLLALQVLLLAGLLPPALPWALPLGVGDVDQPLPFVRCLLVPLL